MARPTARPADPAGEPAAAGRVALELRGITKHYGDCYANRDVDLRVATQTIHAVVGENGAGKSTLMKVAYGHTRADAGEISIKGQPITRHSVSQAIARGVGMVHQHFMLVGPLTVAENVILGRELRRGPLLDLARASAEIRALSRKFGLDVDPAARVEDLSVGQQQRVEILKVLWRGCDVLILDEPTAVLTPGEVRDLFAVLRGLVADGMTIVLITHKLDEVMEIADHVTVMRRGAVVAELARAELSPDAIARAMVGRPVSLQLDKRPAQIGAPVLEVSELKVTGARGIPAVRGVSLTVRAGEIVGIAGVEGNGQSELIEAIVGLRPIDAGTISLGGRDLTGAPVYDRYQAGLAHIPEDRHDRALILEDSIADNLILGLQRAFTWQLDLMDRGRIARRAEQLIGEFDVRPPDPAHPVRGMSGGNQQKVVVARELSRGAGGAGAAGAGAGKATSVLLCAQPTRGVDIGAIEAIHKRMLEARDRGIAVLLVSAELSELRSLSDRLVVMFRGQLVATLEAAELAADHALERVGALMVGAASGRAP
ncbi:MAG TPA: ABC transporter ATP-binding protein [Kofleriaceae bacterium]|nr:ABC transporter ATP-binding protein [Kofleriaceae bacterium]